MFVSAIIAAGGRGERLGGDVFKQLRKLNGSTVLELSIKSFDESDCINEIVVVLPSELFDSPPDFLESTKTTIRVVKGGRKRHDSVKAGLEVVSEKSDVVVIHDAARPFCTTDLIEKTVKEASISGAAIAAVPVFDTVKQIYRREEVSVIGSTLNRDEIVLAQTPQAFRIGIIRDAIAQDQGKRETSDEAAIVERSGHEVHIVSGDPCNIKITTVSDLRRAKAMSESRDGEFFPGVRVGVGYDLHRLVAGRRLILGGIEIPSQVGLLGHSDADVVCHAVSDAILGAANAGDIGKMFPDDEQKWKDASSIKLLQEIRDLISKQGFEVGNIDIVVVAERPKISSFSDAIKQCVAEALSITPFQVSIKGKTNEGVDAVGRGEAIAVHAIASLICRRERSGDEG